MTPKTLQCKVFWSLLSSSEHLGVPEDPKSPTLEVLGFTPTLGQSGVATSGQFRDYTLGVPGKRAIRMPLPWVNTENTIGRMVVTPPESGPW
jgi:hypothetical protein